MARRYNGIWRQTALGQYSFSAGCGLPELQAQGKSRILRRTSTNDLEMAECTNADQGKFRGQTLFFCCTFPLGAVTSGKVKHSVQDTFRTNSQLEP